MIRRRDALLGALAAPIALATTRALAADARPVDRPIDLTEIFRRHGVEGAFVLYDRQSGATFVHGGARADQRFPPCSTFKIPNALFAFDLGVAPDESFTLKWDGVKHEIDSWNRDHDLASAIRASCVWYFQEIARRIGLPRMKEKVAAIGYGNRDVGTKVDEFWLGAPLAISPREQCDFVKRLHEYALPIRREAIDMLRPLIVKEKTSAWTLSGKTGMGDIPDHVVGWLVGTFEKGDRAWHYATLLLAPKGETMAAFHPKRRAVTMEALAALGVV